MSMAVNGRNGTGSWIPAGSVRSGGADDMATARVSVGGDGSAGVSGTTHGRAAGSSSIAPLSTAGRATELAPTSRSLSSHAQ
jgi:hypothetical protein